MTPAGVLFQMTCEERRRGEAIAVVAARLLLTEIPAAAAPFVPAFTILLELLGLSVSILLAG